MGEWYLISDRDAREKVSHALRDSVRDLLKSLRAKQRKVKKKDNSLDTPAFLLQSDLKKNPSMNNKINQYSVPTTLCYNDIFQNNKEYLSMIRTPENKEGQKQKQRDSIVSLFDGLAHEIADVDDEGPSQRSSLVSLDGNTSPSRAELDLLRLSLTDISIEGSRRQSTLSM